MRHHHEFADVTCYVLKAHTFHGGWTIFKLECPKFCRVSIPFRVTLTCPNLKDAALCAEDNQALRISFEQTYCSQVCVGVFGFCWDNDMMSFAHNALKALEWAWSPIGKRINVLNIPLCGFQVVNTCSAPTLRVQSLPFTCGRCISSRSWYHERPWSPWLMYQNCREGCWTSTIGGRIQVKNDARHGI